MDHNYEQWQREKAWEAEQLKALQAKWAVCEHSYRRRTTGGKRSGRQTYREPHLHCHKCQHEKPIKGVTDDGTHVRVSPAHHVGSDSAGNQVGGKGVSDIEQI